ncbi:hypothetical protein RND81_06G007700 [Saponaria officinalis]|uniref:Glycosyltransferase n=1 Tax=Saponaria officinalis TaxID=3572 RepID=A0AAW1K3K1_SAPOF
MSSKNNMKMLHIVVFPWLAFGHLLPFLNLSKYLATKGHRISFLSTLRNLQRLPKIPHHLQSLVTLAPIPLPRVAGLPPDAEATTDLNSDKVPLLREAYYLMQEGVARFLEGASHVDWIIHDFNPWIGPTADRFGIKTAFFITTNAWTITVTAPTSYYKVLLEDGPGHGPNTEPDNRNLLYKIHEARKSLGNIDKNVEESKITIKNCDVIFIRSCQEFEPESMQLLEVLYKKPVVPVGLIPIFHMDDDEGVDTWLTVSGWLDKRKKWSVVYVALGSEASPTQEQITELALGLEESKLPFIWALRNIEGPSYKRVAVPHGFEERTRETGLILTKWAPQTRILAHESVGAFLTHCGCSSVIEGLQFGKPLIMLPFFMDQILNTQIFKDKNVGVEIVKDEKNGSIWRKNIGKLVKLLLDDESGKIYREEAMKMSKIVGDQELHFNYFEKLEEYLRNN